MLFLSTIHFRKENQVLHPHPNTYIWEPRVSDEAFIQTMRTPMVIDKINEINERVYSSSSQGIESAVNDIQTAYYILPIQPPE